MNLEQTFYAASEIDQDLGWCVDEFLQAEPVHFIKPSASQCAPTAWTFRARAVRLDAPRLQGEGLANHAAIA